jgi:hypothetical protein
MRSGGGPLLLLRRDAGAAPNGAVAAVFRARPLVASARPCNLLPTDRRKISRLRPDERGRMTALKAKPKTLVCNRIFRVCGIGPRSATLFSVRTGQCYW